MNRIWRVAAMCLTAVAVVLLAAMLVIFSMVVAVMAAGHTMEGLVCMCAFFLLLWVFADDAHERKKAQG